MSKTAADTLALLQDRIVQLENSLSVVGTDVDTTNRTVRDRLKSLDKTFSRLCSSVSPPAKDVLALHHRIPELQTVSGWRTEAVDSEQADVRAHEILAFESDYSAAASSLDAIHDLSKTRAIQSLTALNSIYPGLRKAQQTFDLQANTADDLRRRSAFALMTWYQQGFTENGEYWCMIEDRLARIEQKLRPKEHEA